MKPRFSWGRLWLPVSFFVVVFTALTQATPPLWWSDGNPPAITGATQENHAVANIGQAKWMVSEALRALDATSPTSAASIRSTLAGILPDHSDRIIDLTVPNPKPADWLDKQKAPLLIGQLKAIAAPFYSRLHAISPAWLEAQRTANGTNQPGSIYPWTAETTDDNNKGIATIGQLKAVFSLRFETLPPPAGGDIPGGGDPGNGNPPGGGVVVTPPTPTPGDEDGDGLSTEDETAAGADPNAVSPLDPAMVAFGNTSFVIIPLLDASSMGSTPYQSNLNQPPIVTDKGDVYFEGLEPNPSGGMMLARKLWRAGVVDSSTFENTTTGNTRHWPSLPNRAGYYTVEHVVDTNHERIDVNTDMLRIGESGQNPINIPLYRDVATTQIMEFDPNYVEADDDDLLLIHGLYEAHISEDGTFFGMTNQFHQNYGSIFRYGYWATAGASPSWIEGAGTLANRGIGYMMGAAGFGETSFFIDLKWGLNGQDFQHKLEIRDRSGAVLDDLLAKGFYEYFRGEPLLGRNGHIVQRGANGVMLYDLKTKEVETVPMDFSIPFSAFQNGFFVFNEIYLEQKAMLATNDQGDLLLQGGIYASLPATDVLLRKFTDPATGAKKWAKCRLDDTKLPEGWSNLKVNAISNSMPLEKQLELAAQTPAAYPVAAEKAPVPMVAGTAVKDGKEIPILGVSVEVAPEVLAVNSDFDEGRIDPATGYAIPDCDDIPGVDQKTGSGNTQIALNATRDHLDGLFANDEKVTDDLHKGWFGVNPNKFGDDFWNGANLTIRKIDKIDDETGYQESGQVRFYAKWNGGYYGISPYDFQTLQPVNLVSAGVNLRAGEGVYGASSTIPDGAEFYMEGVRPGKITLEWRLQKGTMDVKYEQTFKVETRKTRDEWRKEVVYQIRLQTKVKSGTEVDLRTYNPNLGFYGDLGDQTPKVRAIYYYYRQLFQQMPEKFMWAGMAKVAAAPIYAGMSDLTEWYHASELTPGTGFGTRDPGTRSFINNLLLSGQKRIFEDMAWTHRAYQASGIWAIEQAVTLENESITDLDAWRTIDGGIQENLQSEINKGNKELLIREQRDVVQTNYSAISSVFLRQPPAFLTWWVNGVTVSVNSAGLANAGEWLSANANKNPLNPQSPYGPKFRTIVPGGRLDVYANRWAWTSNPTNGMLEMWTGESTGGVNFNAAKRMSNNDLSMRQAASVYTNSNTSMLPND